MQISQQIQAVYYFIWIRFAAGVIYDSPYNFSGIVGGLDGTVLLTLYTSIMQILNRLLAIDRSKPIWRLCSDCKEIVQPLHRNNMEPDGAASIWRPHGDGMVAVQSLCIFRHLHVPNMYLFKFLLVLWLEMALKQQAGS